MLDITTRRGWGARTNRIGRPMGRVSRLIVHHFWRPDVPADATRATERSVMRGVEAFHASKGWSAAPGYQWVIFDSGRVYEGVGWGRTGVHTAGQNSVTVAFCFGNDGDQAQPTAAAWQASYELQRVGIAGRHLTRSYDLFGHRDFAPKSCPGNRTYPHIDRVRTGVEVQEDDMIYMNTRGDGQAAACQVLANRALRWRHRRMQAEGLPTAGNELKVDDWAGPSTHDRVNWLLDEYFDDTVSRRKQETITAGALALLSSIETIERDRLRRLQAP